MIVRNNRVVQFDHSQGILVTMCEQIEFSNNINRIALFQYCLSTSSIPLEYHVTLGKHSVFIAPSAFLHRFHSILHGQDWSAKMILYFSNHSLYCMSLGWKVSALQST